MKYDLHAQFTPAERALLLLNKYPKTYLTMAVNGIIEKSRRNNEVGVCNYWNEVATEMKRLILKHSK